MIEIRISGGVLDLLPNTSITIEEHNPAYLGENVEVLRGAFSYPFTLPLSHTNRRLLGYLDRLDGTTRQRKVAASLYVNGSVYIAGDLYIEEPSRTQVKVYIAGNSLMAIKDTPVNELCTRIYELGEEVEDILAHMLTVSQAPLDYDYTFFPVYDQSLEDETEAGHEYALSRHHNAWDVATSEFTADGPLVMFPRLEVVISDVMAATGYTFVNNFQRTNELRRLVMVNNRSILGEENEVPAETAMADHLTSQKAGEFVRNVCRLFCLAPFADERRRTITLQPLGDILQRDTQLDWTAYAGREYSYTQAQAALIRLGYPAGAYSEAPYEQWKPDLQQADYETDDLAGEPFIEGFYYDYSTGDLLRYFQGRISSGTRPAVRRLGVHFGAIDNENGDERNEPEIYPVFGQIGYLPPGAFANRWQVAMWQVGRAQDGGRVENRLAFHYGNSTTQDGDLYPMGHWNNFEQGGNVYPGSQYSLGWEGPYGIYEKWWKRWDTMLQTGKMVTRDLLLPEEELMRFSFDKKVRIENKDYFIRSMRYTVGSEGVGKIQAKMFSVS